MPVPVFAVGEVLTAANMNQIGLWKIAETTFTTAANPFINGCFSSDYRNYMVKINCFASATPTNVVVRLRSGTNTVETASVYDRFGFEYASGTAVISLVNSAQPGANLGQAFTSTQRFVSQVDFYEPNVATATSFWARAWSSASGNLNFPSFRISNTTQYTGLELNITGGATITGSMVVYGYRN
jgi:hypothetical protein